MSTATATSAAEPPEDNSSSAEQVQRLQAQIHEAERLLAEEKADYERILAEAKKSRDGAASSTAELRVKLAEAKQREAVLLTEQDAVQTEYEHSLRNKDLRERVDAAQKETEELEKHIAELQSSNSQLEKKLERVSSEYKHVQDRRSMFVGTLKQSLEDLHAEITKKISQSIDAEDITCVQPFTLLELLGDLVNAREREVQQCHRLMREVTESVKLKTENADALQSESAKTLSDRRRERAETVKRLVYAFQEERSTLQADIEEIRRVNAEQSQCLTRGQVNKTRDPHVFHSDVPQLTPSGRRQPVKRVTALRVEDAASAEERMLQKKNQEMEIELNECLQKIHTALHLKTELAKVQKQVKLQIAVDRTDSENQLRDLEMQVVSEVERVRKLNKENARLADAVKHLTDVVRSTRSHMDRIRSNIIALPIEAD